MNFGKQFEQQFKASVPANAYYYRIKDTASGWQNHNDINTETPNMSLSRFTPKNEFDTILYKIPILFILELKSTKGTSFSFTGKSPMIKQHQIDELIKASKTEGIVSGLIFNFRNKNNTYFINIKDFVNFKENTTKVSINENDVIKYNGLLIKSQLMRTRFKYDLDGFIKYFEENK